MTTPEPLVLTDATEDTLDARLGEPYGGDPNSVVITAESASTGESACVILRGPQVRELIGWLAAALGQVVVSSRGPDRRIHLEWPPSGPGPVLIAPEILTEVVAELNERRCGVTHDEQVQAFLVTTPGEHAARRDLAASAGPLAERHITDCARCGFAIAPGQHVEAVLPAGFVLAPGQPVTLPEAVSWAHVDCRAAGTPAPGEAVVTHVEGRTQ